LGDILITRVGTYGITSYVSANEQFCLGQNIAAIKPNIDARYLYFCLQSPFVKNQIEQSVVGSTQKPLSLGHIKKLVIPIFAEPEQKRISDLLGSLEDKIELNRRMNATLEAMAQALFKSWFVDFDPVKAKAEGRTPEGMDAETAALFPDRFEGSELGEIPAGWSTGSILTQAKVLSGGTPKTEQPDYWNGSIRWASAKDVSQARQTFLVTTERTITSKGLEESATQLIPALGTVIAARGATTGRMVLLGTEMAMNQTCYALVSSIGTPLALHCRLRQAIDALVHAAHGSVFDTITTSTFSTSKIVLPSTQTLQVFEQIVSSIVGKILTATGECLALTPLRDTLLPKLISGQLRIPEAEAMAEGIL